MRKFKLAVSVFIDIVLVSSAILLAFDWFTGSNMSWSLIGVLVALIATLGTAYSLSGRSCWGNVLAWLLVSVSSALLLTGCGATRQMTIGERSIQHEPTDVSMGFWGSLFEPGIEARNNELADHAYRRQQSAVFHRKAIEAAEATTVSKPLIDNSPIAQPFDRPVVGKEIPSFGAEGFSRYSEEEETVNPAAESYEFNSLSSPATFHIRPAVQSGVVQPPLAGQEGALPVVFINDGRYRSRRLVVRQERGPWYEVNLSAGERAVRYLQLGRHYVEVYDQNGRPQKIRDPRRDVYRRSGSYRFRDRSWDYTGSFEVESVPTFIDETGNQYFGVFRTY